jgi:beta-RFAP synthase
MTRLRATTSSRLHFGLLGWGPGSLRQFGGVGLMIADPGIEVLVEPSPTWSAEGPLAARALQLAQRVAGRLHARSAAMSAAHLRIVRAPREHVGLGTGTQLSLAVVRLVCALAGEHDPSVLRLAELAERGHRSGIGLYGFLHGGLIVDGGHRDHHGIPPLVSRLAFPDDWSILIVMPEVTPGYHGSKEAHAFANLPAIAEGVSERLCRLVLLGLLPAVVERDLETFGDCLSELQLQVGRCFAPAQGGTFAHPEIEAIVAFLEQEGLHGVGQSSWGPAIYAFTDRPESERAAIQRRFHERFGTLGGEAFWTTASNHGATIE